MRLLVTGGCGFIGSNFIRQALARHSDWEITNLDALTYAGNPANLADVAADPRYRFVAGRIERPGDVRPAIAGRDAVVHFAAESHVDRSIVDATPFVLTNVLGTQVLLDAALAAGVRRFVHVSTDEVYGELGAEGAFTEDTPFSPRSPYAASKAAGDLLALACQRTHGLSVSVARPSNNYGPFQLPEKLVPLAVTNVLAGRPVPVYGRGENVRDWLFVTDCCAGIEAVLLRGRPGRAYNLGGHSERRNIDVVKAIINRLGRGDLEFVTDRPGHDFRYALDSSRAGQELGWRPLVEFDAGLRQTVEWYVEHPEWWTGLVGRLPRAGAGFWKPLA
jgi:dTDP-glucose 4,6-dehydratase